MQSVLKKCLVILLFLLSTSCWAVPRYKLTDLGKGVASAINNHGQVVGHSNPVYQISHAVIWQKGAVQEIGPAWSQAYSINDKGQVVGLCKGRAVVWQFGQMTELIALPPPNADFDPAFESGATSINDAGQIVGYCIFRAHYGPESRVQRVDFTYGFLWQHGRMTSMGLQNDALTAAINNLGKINFFISVHGPNDSHLGVVTGINDRNQIIGTLYLGRVTKNNRNIKHAFLSFNGKARDLGTLGGLPSVPHAVNNSGDVVGDSDTASHRPYQPNSDNSSHAFLWRTGKMWDLNRFLPVRSGWVLLSANGINDRGQVVGDGMYKNRHHAFLLTPVP